MNDGPARGHEPPGHLMARLGPVPDSERGLDAWCGLADLLEKRADYQVAPASTASRLDTAIRRLGRQNMLDPLEHPREIIAAAERLGPRHDHAAGADGPARWQHTVTEAAHRVEAAHQRTVQLDHDHGLSL